MSKLSYWLCSMVVMLLAAAPGAARDRNPVLILGKGEGFYGYLDRRYIVEEILTPSELIFDQDTYVSATKWGGYAVVIVCNQLDELAAPEEMRAAEQFVRQGGRLVLLGTALRAFDLTKPETAWLAARGNRVEQLGSEAAVMVKDTSYSPRQRIDELPAAFEVGFTVATTDEAVVKVATKGKNVLSYAAKVGDGDLVFLGREYFRVRIREKKEKKPFGGEAMRDWLAHLIIDGGAINSRQYIDRSKIDGDKPLVWFRDPGETSRGAAFFREPLPKPIELLRRVELDMGVNEYESFPIYVTSPTTVDSFPVHVTDLRSGQNVLPGSRFRIRQQGMAKPDLKAGPFWLLDAGDPKKPVFKLAANTAGTFWFTFDTTGLTAGTYDGSIHFGDTVVPLSVKVWPVSLPGREYLEAQATFMWNSIGADPRKAVPGATDPLDYTVFNRHMANLSAHHISYNADAYWPFALVRNATIKETGQTLQEAIAQRKVDLEKLPALDFSVYNRFVDAGIRNGMPFYHYLFKNHPEDWLPFAKAITGNDDLYSNADEHLAVKRWLLSETTQYLRDRGVQRIVSFLADEISNDEVEEALNRGRLIKESGIMPMVTVTLGPGQSPEMMDRLSEVLDVWIWNQVITQSAQKIVAEKPAIVEPTDLEYTYTADWHQAAYMFNRVRGPYSAYHQLDGWLIHGYLRWYPNGGAVFAGEEGPIDTEGWEGARDGIEDGRYVARVMHLLKELDSVPTAKAVVDKVKLQSQGWVGSEPDSLVFLKKSTNNARTANYLDPHVGLLAARQVKREVLAALAELEPLSRSQPRVMVGDLALTEGNHLLAELEGPATVVDPLRAALAAKSGAATLQPAQKPAVRVCLGTADTTGTIKTLLAGSKLGVTKHYPAAGEFIVRTLPAADGQPATIAVYGADDAGLRKGTEQLIALLERRTR